MAESDDIFEEDVRIDLDATQREADPALERAREEEELVPRELPIPVLYDAPDGETYEDNLISRVPGRDDRVRIGRICGALAGSTPWAALPGGTAAYFWSLANVRVRYDLPAWAKKWVEQDTILLDRLHDAAEVHEARFFRGDRGARAQDPRARRLVVRAPVPAVDTGVDE